ncbi:type IV pilin [Halorhabdus rudnickae]|uniref:type IV pilin n=1 Tax=Halorhabdus rudnickae TaxID=1775544 RepID=UPI00108406AA|nr:type IV pilin N-terminal domain-containing protein [Halorhabdus rudnickae]
MVSNHFVCEKRGVSPVIGVILMVAITVILAGVIGAFVMNMNTVGETQPNTQWEWYNDTGAGHIELSHTGGDASAAGNLVLAIGDNRTAIDTAGAFDSDDKLTAGDTLTFNASSGGSMHLNVGADPSGIEEVKLIWEDSTTDRSRVISSYEP